MNATFTETGKCSICGHPARIEIDGPEPLRLCRGCWNDLRVLCGEIGPIEGKNAGTKGKEC